MSLKIEKIIPCSYFVNEIIFLKIFSKYLPPKEKTFKIFFFYLQQVTYFFFCHQLQEIHTDSINHTSTTSNLCL